VTQSDEIGTIKTELSNSRHQLDKALEEIQTLLNCMPSEPFKYNKGSLKAFNFGNINSVISSHKSVSKISRRGRLADESDNEDISFDSKQELSILNQEFSTLQDENDNLKTDNEKLIIEINNIKFEYEAELETLNIGNQELQLNLSKNGKLPVFTIFNKFRKTTK
jgi:hypothetical protein